MSPSPRCKGRVLRCHWQGFRKVPHNGRSIANCLKCDQFLMNTSVARLKNHRKYCDMDMRKAKDVSVEYIKVELEDISCDTINEVSQNEKKKRGNKYHSYWKGFAKAAENGRTIAQCEICKQFVRNTGVQRMLHHRTKCQAKYGRISNDECAMQHQNIEEKENVCQKLNETIASTNLSTSSSSVASKASRESEDSTYNDHWEGYQKTMRNGKIAAECKICRQIFTNTSAERMQQHRNNCLIPNENCEENEEDIPTQTNKLEKNYDITKIEESADFMMEVNDASGELCEYVDEITETKVLACDTPEATVPQTLSSDTISTLFQVQSGPHLSNATKSEQDEIDLSAAKFIFSSKMALEPNSLKYFNEFCHSLNPAYKPPTWEKLTGPLLEELHKEQLANNATKLATQSNVVLLIKEWKNTTANTLNILTILHNSNHYIFLETFEFTEDTKPFEYIPPVIEKSMELAQQQYGANIFAAVSSQNICDLYENMDVWNCVCHTHIAHLIAQGVIKKYDLVAFSGRESVLNKVHTILKEMKRVQVEQNVTMPSENIQSSICNHLKCLGEYPKLLWLLSKLTQIRQVFEKRDEKSEVNELLYNKRFLDTVQKLVGFLKPLVQLIEIFQQASCTLADVTNAWIEFLKQGPPELCAIASARCEHTNALNKCSLAANFLHPLYRGEKLETDHINIVEDFLLLGLDEAGLNSFIEYKLKAGLFGILFKKTTNPHIFWNMAMRRHKSLATFAQKLLAIPVSISQFEDVCDLNWWCKMQHFGETYHWDAGTAKKLLDLHLTLQISEKNVKSDCSTQEDDCKKVII